MAVFAILSEVPQPELKASVERAYPDRFYHWSETVSFVHATGTAKAIADKIGIQGRDSEGQLKGNITRAVVSQLATSYYGWSKNSLWEWLKIAFEAAD